MGSGGRFQSCIYVEAPSGCFLLDCGASSLIAMKQAGVDPSSINSILISHLHGDHFAGLPFFVLDAHYLARRSEPLLVAGPPSLEARATLAMETLFTGSSQTQRQFELRYLELAEGQETPVGAVKVTASRLAHESGAPSYGFRVDVDGKRIAYSGDTEWTEALAGLAEGADLFICECYTFDTPITQHMTYQTLRRNQARLGCKRLVLTHPGPRLLERLSEVEIEVASDGSIIEL